MRQSAYPEDVGGARNSSRRLDDARLVVPLERWSLDHPPLGPGMQVGVRYAYPMPSHCGVEHATFDGRAWVTDTPLDDGQGNPPADWNQPGTTPTMTLLSTDTAEYRHGTYVLRFRPWQPAPDERPSPCA